MKRDLKKIINEMTLEEKAGMCSGKDFWHLKGVQRLGIPSVMVSDGPHGLRKQEDKADHLGIYDSVEAVCFPGACATAASFDRRLLEDMGTALGKQCQAEGVAILLGPGVNIKRSPICGRNFEYFSEDPYLTGELAACFVGGVQSQNVGTSVKHFAVNNQEYRRGTISAEIDERTLREIYLTAFEIIVKKAKPWTIMCSYNKVNGVFASENKKLLNDILRDEWDFEGYVMSDWGAVNERVWGLKAGLELEMPSSAGITDNQIIEAVKEGSLSEGILDRAVERILEIIFRYADHRIQAEFDREKDHELAVRIEEESAVLLKNEQQILPLSTKQKIAFLGAYAKVPRYQGGGSSHINAAKVSSAYDTARKFADIIYKPAFSEDGSEMKEEGLVEAVAAAKAAQVAVIFAGLPEAFEAEGYDRTHMRLPECQNRLINAVCQVQPNTVVVLHNGSPIEMPWIDQVAGVLELYLGGQGVGEAAVRLLFGQSNPSGKLPESFPVCLANNPSHLYFPGDGHHVEYREGIYVGYRYYDKKELPVLFPFGHGLSYTTFSYSNLQLEKEEITDQDTVKVSVDVTNTGKVAGKEAVQLYIVDLTGTANRPIRELKGFEKIFLNPGETKTIEFLLDKRSFAWYHTGISDWYCATGEYSIEIGKSSRDIVLTKKIQVTTTILLPLAINENTTFGELLKDLRTRAAVLKLLNRNDGKQEEATDKKVSEMMRNMIENAPLRALRSWRGMEEAAMKEMIADLQRCYHGVS